MKSNKVPATGGLSKYTYSYSNYFFRENCSRCTFGRKAKTFPRKSEKISVDPTTLSCVGRGVTNRLPTLVKLKEYDKLIVLK